jgi:hypothetical protein
VLAESCNHCNNAACTVNGCQCTWHHCFLQLSSNPHRLPLARLPDSHIKPWAHISVPSSCILSAKKLPAAARKRSANAPGNHCFCSCQSTHTAYRLYVQSDS